MSSERNKDYDFVLLTYHNTIVINVEPTILKLELNQIIRTHRNVDFEEQNNFSQVYKYTCCRALAR